MSKPMNKNAKHYLPVILSLLIAPGIFHMARAAEKVHAQPGKVHPAAVSPAKDKTVEIKTYTITGHADPATVAKTTAPAKTIPPQLAARRFGPGGRSWNTLMALGGPVRR